VKPAGKKKLVKKIQRNRNHSSPIDHATKSEGGEISYKKRKKRQKKGGGIRRRLEKLKPPCVRSKEVQPATIKKKAKGMRGEESVGQEDGTAAMEKTAWRAAD